MKKAIVIALGLIGGLIGGFIAGIVLSEMIAMIGLQLFDRPIWLRWLRFLPFISALVGAVAVPVVLRRI
ncbi:DUF5957 family protein [Desmospora activa]|uniref:Major facilitator superfamily (MFS) profile domain-containing protein n=1 Tax=Desmospora activa DSM 45169 TaxID=1121389 RepID=A0A2T4ZDS5_9BACL|nr:DUF5957 family protein [Desmospora activa]PTM60039.1 hypothetical protein C8J48_2678 [Desmospora activa DSM 45169]